MAKSDRRVHLLVLTFFFLSGVCGLIYETVWMRLLRLVMGNTVYSISTVLTAFMGGLSLGSYLAGRLVDRTGRPGPSTWEMGDYPEGKDDYPVSGVSWFEAAAYAEFRGKSLPTIYHWARAALPATEIVHSLVPFLIPQSNFDGNGPAEVGTYPGIAASGARDMAGNVREWCWNEKKRTGIVWVGCGKTLRI